MAPLALGGRRGGGRGYRPGGQAAQARAGPHQGHVGGEHMGHDEVGTVGERGADQREGLARVAMVGVERLLVEPGRVRAGARERQAEPILRRHDWLPEKQPQPAGIGRVGGPPVKPGVSNRAAPG
jgi:hypothetical protein